MFGKGQTLFQLLKRNKQTPLEDIISKSRVISEKATSRVKIGRSVTPNQLDYKKTFRENDSVEEPNLTPKRANLNISQQKQHNKSFMEMISPMHRKSVDKCRMREGSPKEPKKAVYQEISTKKNLKAQVEALRQILEKFIKTGESIKDKSHSLFVQMKPIIRFIKNSDNYAMEKKVDAVTWKLKTLENLMNDFDTSNSEKSIEIFNQTLSEHLNSMEGIMKNEIQNSKSQLYMELIPGKDKQIQSLKDQVETQSKQLRHLIKKHEKKARNAQNHWEDVQVQQDNLSRNYQTKLSAVSLELQAVLAENTSLQSEIEALARELHEKNKECKKVSAVKETQSKLHLHEITKVKSEKEEYLMAELMGQKQDYRQDILTLNQLHQAKQSEAEFKISAANQEIARLNQTLQKTTQLLKEVQSSEGSLEKQLQQTQRHNESLVTDLRRINEELYQHWLALKDVRVLLERLTLFDKFRRIYQDLAFNEHLFS